MVCAWVCSAGRKMRCGRKTTPWSLSRNCGTRRRSGTSTTVWAVGPSSPGGSASTTAGQQSFRTDFPPPGFYSQHKKPSLHISVCLPPDCVAVRSVTTAAVTRSALGLASAESAAACTVTISTARWWSATRRRKRATAPLGRLWVVFYKPGEP